MELKKEKDLYAGTYTITLKEESKELKLYYDRDNNLHMSISDGKTLNNKQGDYIFMDINLEDGNIYDAIYNFYSKLVDKSKKTQKKNVLDIENNVVLLSEDRKEDTADKLMIINYGEILRIKFIRTGSNIITFKPRKSINIKFRMYDSRYDEYTQDIIKLYKDINGIEARKVYRR